MTRGNLLSSPTKVYGKADMKIRLTATITVGGMKLETLTVHRITE